MADEINSEMNVEGLEDKNPTEESENIYKNRLRKIQKSLQTEENIIKPEAVKTKKKLKTKPTKPKDSHKQIHSIQDLGPFTCTKLSNDGSRCNETYVSCCEYSTHDRDEHQRNRRSLKCMVCEKLLRTIDDEDDSPYRCWECGLGFDFEEDVQYHYQLKHNKMRNHVCNYCHKSFTESFTLRSHIRLHTGEKPFSCDYCDRSFNQKTHLKVHIRTHTDEKPYSCVVCSKKFSQNAALRSHMRSHTNIKPFQCKICKMTFKAKRNVDMHLERRHKNTEFLDSDEINDDDGDDDSKN